MDHSRKAVAALASETLARFREEKVAPEVVAFYAEALGAFEDGSDAPDVLASVMDLAGWTYGRMTGEAQRQARATVDHFQSGVLPCVRAA